MNETIELPLIERSDRDTGEEGERNGKRDEGRNARE